MGKLPGSVLEVRDTFHFGPISLALQRYGFDEIWGQKWATFALHVLESGLLKAKMIISIHGITLLTTLGVKTED